jgi:hypothetical protein
MIRVTYSVIITNVVPVIVFTDFPFIFFNFNLM